MRITLISLAIFMFITSCRKTNNGEDYRNITISGTVFDSSNRVGMADVTVRIFWYGPQFQETPVDSVKTNEQGNYSIKLPIDISRFKDQSLTVAAVVPEGFISVVDIEHPNVGASIVGYSEFMDLPDFPMYQKTNLAINLSRTSNDAFTELGLYYNYGGRDYWANFGNSKPTGSVSFNVSTASGVQTNVYWKKKQSSGDITMFRDSIIPKSGIANTITIPY